MEQTEILIKPLTEEYLDVFAKLLLINFDDKFGVVFKGISLETSCSIMKDLITLMKDKSGVIDGYYIALINQKQNSKVVGVLSLMHRGLQIKEKLYKDIQWKTLRKYLSFWKSLKIGIKLDFFSVKKLRLDELYIDSISVSEEYRGKGIGSKLLNFTEILARSLNFRRISLYVSCKNNKAKNLYDRWNYQEMKKRKSWIGKRLLKVPFFFLMIKNIS